ncbi:lipocalin family protein [Polynucleobacter sp. MG-5-Ahmo-C2]|jgi:apolipoprotein D and lipocalin family protein|uniref:lipocalin family protein n=1 Tax=Polynucleobacter sp. MG-5-Ahmo-C2 TaxID=2081051 RepID=UPI001BFEC858|nr:lipocalin family protein [Polynucleobacter sp. MG-5-Ahmo-C2]QWD98875.1 lipocalin family protein [Polynucleobacter sp. MG-5-Ahmo-C2]
MMKIQVALVSLLLAVCLPADGQSDTPVRTIASLDVPKYLGTWYEIAKFPNWFQKKCIGNTKAVYSLRSDGNLKVLNSCKTADGDISEAEGEARQVGGKDSPRLEVRFAPAWLSFLPMVWGDYWVIDLDPQYQLAIVSDPRREYLWILSRVPQLDKKVYEDLLQKLQMQQFDIRKLEVTAQSSPKN